MIPDLEQFEVYEKFKTFFNLNSFSLFSLLIQPHSHPFDRPADLSFSSLSPSVYCVYVEVVFLCFIWIYFDKVLRKREEEVKIRIRDIVRTDLSRKANQETNN